MAIQLQGNSGTVAEVDGTSYRAMRVANRPLDVASLGHYRLSMASGTMAAALTANSELFQFRWTDATRLAVIHKVLISAGANVAATAAALITLEATVARSWTVAGTGGTAATITGNNQKVRTSMGTTLLGEARMATTTGLGAGTKTLDSQGIGNLSFGIGTGAITTTPNLTLFPKTDLLEMDANEPHPLVLAQNEGFVVKNGAVAWPAGMTWVIGVSVIWAEIAAY
jgi:hypothetical protein